MPYYVDADLDTEAEEPFYTHWRKISPVSNRECVAAV